VEKQVPAVKAQAPVQVKGGVEAEQVLRALANSEAERALAGPVAVLEARLFLAQGLAAGAGSAWVECQAEVEEPGPTREIQAPEVE